MHLHAERFRLFIRRHGEPVFWMRAVAAAQVARRAPGQITNEALSPRVSPAKAPPSSDGNRVGANGWIYQRQELDPRVAVWIFDEKANWDQESVGVQATGTASIVWMPDELQLVRPDKLVRFNSERPARERVVIPADGQRLPLAHELTFAVDRITTIASNGALTDWIHGTHWEGDGGLGLGPVIHWLSGSRPEVGSEVSVESRFFPAFYFSGEGETSRRREWFAQFNTRVTGAPGESYLPRFGQLSLSHPDAQWPAHELSAP